MRCACCLRKIKPETAWSDHHGRKYGPICATKQFGYVPSISLKPKRSRKPSRFAVFNTVVKQDDFQDDFFGAAA